MRSNGIPHPPESFRQNKQIIESYISPLNLPILRHNQNNAWFTNSSHIYKINDRWAARLMVKFLKDEISFQNESATQYTLPDAETVETRIAENAVKSPLVFNPELKLTWKNKRDQLLEIDVSYMDNMVETENVYQANAAENMQYNLDANLRNGLAKINYTQKLKKSLAWESELLTSLASESYELILKPVINRNSGEYAPGEMQQYLENTHHFSQIKNQILGRTAKEHSYTIAHYLSYRDERLQSNLADAYNAPQINDLALQNAVNQLQAKFNFKFNKLEIEPEINLIQNYVRYRQQTVSCFRLVKVGREY